MDVPKPASTVPRRLHWLGSPALTLTLGFFALYLATFDSDMGSPDENQRYALGVSIARDGLRMLVGSGHLSKYPPLQSMLAAPLMKLGLLLDHGGDDLWTHRFGLSLSLLACTALIPLFFRAARTLEVPERRAAFATALFGLTNPIWPYGKRFFSEPLTSALALGCFAGALAFLKAPASSRRRFVPLTFSLVCLALLPLNNMVVPIAMGASLGVMFLREKRRLALLPLGVASFLGGGAALLLFKIRFGSFTDPGYGHEGFTFNIPDGLHGLLFGPGRSVFLFAPLLTLAMFGLPSFFRRFRTAGVGLAVASLVTLFFISSWWCWWGGICWGPRLMLPVLPIATLPVVTLLERPAPWKRLASLAFGLAGLYVQVLGFSFKHDFDIYFWMRTYEVDERKSWMTWEFSQLHRMPRHFREHPWDLSSSFLTLVQKGPSIVEVNGAPAKRIELENLGDEIVFHWSISDLYAVLKDGSRVPAGKLGARLETFNGQDGAGALDGNRDTRWSSNSKRLAGMKVTLVFPEPRTDVVRLEVEHVPFDRDFPNGLAARVSTDGRTWTPVPAKAAIPGLHFSPLIYLVSGVGLALLGVSLRRRADDGQASVPAPPVSLAA